MSAVARTEGLKVTPEELDEELGDTAAQYGMDNAKLRKTLEEKGQLGAFEQSLLLDKAQKFLADNAKAVPPKSTGEAEATPEAVEAAEPAGQTDPEPAESQPEASGGAMAEKS